MIFRFVIGIRATDIIKCDMNAPLGNVPLRYVTKFSLLKARLIRFCDILFN